MVAKDAKLSLYFSGSDRLHQEAHRMTDCEAFEDGTIIQLRSSAGARIRLLPNLSSDSSALPSGRSPLRLAAIFNHTRDRRLRRRKACVKP